LEIFAHSGREDERLARRLVFVAADGLTIPIKTEALYQFQRLFYDGERCLLGYTRREAYNTVKLGEVTVLNHSVRLVQHKELDALNLSGHFIVLTCGT